jgi:HEAT repeat protein
MRELAVRGLGRIEDESSILSLLSALEDSDETVRLATETALAGISNPALAPILLTSLNASSAFAQRAIAHALGSYPDAQVIESLRELMTAEGDLRTRLTAAQSLSRLGDERGTTMILRTLNAPNQETRRIAAIALGMTGDPRAVAPLIETARRGTFDAATPEGRRQRRRMFEAMAAVGAEILPPLIDLLASGDPAVSGLAADALAQMGSKAVTPLANALSSHPDITVRVAAARLLGRLREREAVEPLMETLRETLVGPYPLVFLLRLFGDRTAPVRAAAAAAIGEIGGLDGAGLLLSSSRYDPSMEVNEAAEAALARSGAPAVIARLAQPDVTGYINRALAAGLALLMVGFVAGAATRLWGVADAVPLIGLASAGVLGLADGLEGRRRPIRLALAGSLAGGAAAWLILLAGQSGWESSLAAAALPAVGALVGWSRAVPMQRLAGLFGGAILGFIGAGAAALILGTIGP